MDADGTQVSGQGMSGERPPQAPETFTRKASGLIRSATVLDVLGFNVLCGLTGIAALWLLVLGPPLYPGANLVLATLIGGLAALPLVMVYARLSAVYPRSGGEYVYASRLLHPAVGFAVNVGFTVAILFIMAIGGNYLANYGLAPLLRVAGAYWSSPGLVNAGNWLTEPLGMFLLGTATIVAFGLLFILGGMRVYWPVQNVLMIMASLSVIVIVIWGLVVSRQTAFAHIAQALGNVGGKSLEPLATGTAAPFSWSETIKASIWANFGIVGVFFTAYIGGEVKRPARTQAIGMLVSWAWVTGWMAAICAAMVHLFGTPFFANMLDADMSKYGLSAAPAFQELSGLGLGSGVAAVILLVLFLGWGLGGIPTSIMMCSRTIFSWSLDRVVPGWLSHVSTRSAVPYNAVWAMMIIGVIFTAALAWGWMTVLGGSYGFFAAFAAAALSAVVLAYRNPSLWRSSPGHTRLWGVATTTWWGLVSLLVAIVFPVYLLLIDPVAGITPRYNFNQFIVFPIIIVVAFAGYYVARAIQKGRGIDLDLKFQEIPPD